VKLQQFEPINTFVLDVDGVLTNGNLVVQNDGSLLRTMHIKDGYAMQLAIKKGYTIVIISGANNAGIVSRLQGLGITHIHMGVPQKLTILNTLIQQQVIHPSTTLYMGDDMPDLECMQAVALPCAPADACTEVLQAAKYISPISGGQGCVRDVIEKVLKLNYNWL
jgi:3-deoxy-D-manno-octulosonate 8-phosphate phosphatase (KDO 8-P phosphatase)